MFRTQLRSSEKRTVVLKIDEIESKTFKNFTIINEQLSASVNQIKT